MFKGGNRKRIMWSRQSDAYVPRTHNSIDFLAQPLQAAAVEPSAPLPAGQLSMSRALLLVALPAGSRAGEKLKKLRRRPTAYGYKHTNVQAYRQPNVYYNIYHQTLLTLLRPLWAL